MSLTPEKPRWEYRFDNFSHAYQLLHEAIAMGASRPLSSLEKEGVIQRFEYTWELGWKLLKDYLEASGVVLDTITPATVIRAAFAAKLIRDGELWMQALKARNEMSHAYDSTKFEKTIHAIHHEYFALLAALYQDMLQRKTKEAPDALA